MTEARQTFVRRMIGAARFDLATYEEVEHDTGATGQAAAVVVLVAVCSAIGGLDAGSGGVIGRPIGELMGWLLWSGVTFFIGTRVFDGEATWGELLRTIGFAKSPGVLFAVAGVGVIGGLAAGIAGIWILFAGLVAIRQALDIPTGEALITAFLGWLSYVAIGLVMWLILGIPAMVFTSLR